jgi:DNA repair exonuclease SbcCD ATPase subunit
MQILQMRIERMDLFHSHQSRFVTWIDKMRSNIDQKESRVSDLIFIFENHYRLEIEQKQNDMDNLKKLKDQMTEEKFSDSEEIIQKTDDASKQYKDLKNYFDKKLAKLHQLLDAQLKLETELQELKHWLSETEKRINEPMKFECISSEHKKESENKIIDKELQLKQHSEKISSILNHGEMLISDQDSPCNISQDIINIKDDLERIESKWKELVSTVTEKKHTH